MKEALSVGIIGGADGPTAVLVSGDPVGLIAAVVIVGVAIAFVVYRLLKK